MSNQRHKHNVQHKIKGNIPKAPIEKIFSQSADGESKVFLGSRKVDHTTKDAVLHPCKGYRSLRKQHNHSLLFSLLLKYNIVPYEAN